VWSDVCASSEVLVYYCTLDRDDK